MKYYPGSPAKTKWSSCQFRKRKSENKCYYTSFRSTLSDANNKRSYQVFETIYYGLLKQYHSFISDSRLKGLSIRNLKIIDSTTIQLFCELLQGVGRNRLDGGRKKGGIKVHAMMDAFSGVTEFVRMTEAREHDRKFLYHLKLPAGSWLVLCLNGSVTNGRD